MKHFVCAEVEFVRGPTVQYDFAAFEASGDADKDAERAKAMVAAMLSDNNTLQTLRLVLGIQKIRVFILEEEEEKEQSN